MFDDLSFIGGGYINTNNAYAGTIGGGAANAATGNYSTVAGGAQAIAGLYGQSAHANGGFTSPGGDAQASEYVLRRTSTGTNTTELFLDGTAERLTTPMAGTWTFDILVAARSSSGDSAGFRTDGVIKNVGGTVTLLSGQKTMVPFVSDAALGASRVILSATSNALVVSVKGSTNAPSSTNRWVATVHTSEVKY